MATLFDDEPRTKETILLDAQSAATAADLKARIADDLKRVRLIGEPVPLHFTSVQGKPVSMEDFAGKPVILIFFADFSIPSANAITTVQRAVAELPKGAVEVIGVSLDNTREELVALMKTHHIVWPVAYDGKGWQSELVRSLGRERPSHRLDHRPKRPAQVAERAGKLRRESAAAIVGAAVIFRKGCAC